MPETTRGTHRDTHKLYPLRSAKREDNSRAQTCVVWPCQGPTHKSVGGCRTIAVNGAAVHDGVHQLVPQDLALKISRKLVDEIDPSSDLLDPSELLHDKIADGATGQIRIWRQNDGCRDVLLRPKDSIEAYCHKSKRYELDL